MNCPHSSIDVCEDCRKETAQSLRFEIVLLARCDHGKGRTLYLDAGDMHEGYVWCLECGAYRRNDASAPWLLPVRAARAKELDRSVASMGVDLGGSAADVAGKKLQ